MALGYDRRLFLLALEGADRPAAGGPDAQADVPDRAGVLLDALERAVAATGADPTEVAVLVGDALGPDVARAVTARGFPLALRVDDRDEERFAFAQGDDFGRHIEELAPTLTAVRVRWHPDDAAEVKKHQALGLTRLAAWLHETERALLVDLLVPPTDVDGDPARDDRELHVERTLDAVREIRNLGVEVDVWSLEGPRDRAEAETIAEVVRDEGRDTVAVVARRTASADLLELAPTVASVAAYRGVVFGPDLWADDLETLAADADARDAVVRTVGDRLGAVIDRFTAAQPA